MKTYQSAATIKELVIEMLLNSLRFMVKLSLVFLFISMFIYNCDIKEANYTDSKDNSKHTMYFITQEYTPIELIQSYFFER